MKHRADPRRPGSRARTAATLFALGAGTTAVVAGGLLAVRPAQVAAADAGTVPHVAASTSDAPSPDLVPWQPVRVPLPAVVPDPVTDPGRSPVALHAPDIGVSAVVVPASVAPSGALDVPDDPALVGWWSSGAAPGASSGNVVLAGHVDSEAGVGVLESFLDVPMGTTVEVVDEAGATLTYRIVARRSFSKEEGLPRELFGIDGPPQLVLITCGGTFDAGSGHYSDNVVLYGVVA